MKDAPLFLWSPSSFGKNLGRIKKPISKSPLKRFSRTHQKIWRNHQRDFDQKCFTKYFSTHSIKGEFVLVLGKEEKENQEDSFSLALKKAQDLLLQGYKTKAACNQVAQDFNLSKRSLYQALINTQNTSEGEN